MLWIKSVIGTVDWNERCYAKAVVQYTNLLAERIASKMSMTSWEKVGKTASDSEAHWIYHC